MIALLSGNIFFIFFKQSIDIINVLYYDNWWLGEVVCGFYKYSIFVFAGIILHLHVLITANRIWAISFPVSYRNKHTKQFAVFLCLGAVGYVHMLCFPGVMLDIMYYRIPLSCGCILNFVELKSWTTTVQIIVYDVPILFVCGSYLWIAFQYRRQKGTTTAIVHKGHQLNQLDDDVKVPKEMSNERFKAKFTRTRRSQVSSRAFAVLTFLTASIIISGGPSQVYSTVQMFVDFQSCTLDEICLVLYACQTLVDPVAFVIVQNELKNSIEETVASWFQRIKKAIF